MSIFNLDLINLIQTIGYLGVFLFILAESGLFFGFFLPGDSLLFSAGLLASQNFFNIYLLIFLTFTGAVIGDQIGYLFGKKIGPKIFQKEDSILFKKKYLKEAEIFYQKHGPKTIILARFIPIVRTFAPILAGVAQMDYKTFSFFNVLGGLLWALGIPLLGYFLGENVPNIDAYIWPIIFGIIFLSILPGIFSLFKNKQQSKSIG